MYTSIGIDASSLLFIVMIICRWYLDIAIYFEIDSSKNDEAICLTCMVLALVSEVFDTKVAIGISISVNKNW